MSIYTPIYTPFYRAMPITVQKDNGESKEYLCLADERGIIYSKKDVLLLLEQVKEFYELEDATEMLIDHNKASELDEIIRYISKVKFTKNKNGKYLIPPANYKYKVFKTDKKHWSIKCGWCGEKVSSKIEEGYYSITHTHFNLYERACSEDCAQLIWKEAIKNWIHENEYQKYFE